MTRLIGVIVAILLVVVFVLFTTTYTVRFHEVAVKTHYRKASERSVVTEAGLHFRLPFFADDVSKYDTRLRLAETTQVQVTTADQQAVVVKPFLMWKVDTGTAEGTLRFADSFESVEQADDSLPNQLKSAVSAALGRYAFDDLIGPDSRLAEAEDAIRRELVASLEETGVQPVTVGLSQVLLPAVTTRTVLTRMKAVRDTLAATERARGGSDAAAIQSAANTTADEIEAYANQLAMEIRADGNRLAAEFLDRMQDEEFAVFLEWMRTLEQSLNSQVTIIMTDEAAPWHLLNIAQLPASNGIPQPERQVVVLPGVVDDDDEAGDTAADEAEAAAEQGAGH